MTRRERILDQLLVKPGHAAPRIAERDPGWTGGPDFEGLTHDELKDEARAVLARDVERALGGAGAALGERHPRAAGRLPGDGRRRQGQRHRARHVGRQPAGRPGLLVQEALGRGARPRLPLADREGRARARPDRHLQPLALRRGRRAARASRSGSTRSACRRHPTTRGSGTSASRTSTPSSATSTATARRSSSSSSTSRRPSRSGASSRASTSRTRSGSSTRPTSPSGPAGTTTWPRTRTRSRPRRRPGRRGTSIPADYKWVTQALVAAILVDTIHGLDLQWPTVSEADHEANVAARRELDAEGADADVVGSARS